MKRVLCLLIVVLLVPLTVAADSGLFSRLPGRADDRVGGSPIADRVAQSGRIKVVLSAKRSGQPTAIFYDQDNDGRFSDHEKVCDGFTLASQVSGTADFTTGAAGPHLVTWRGRAGKTSVEYRLFPVGDLFCAGVAPYATSWTLELPGELAPAGDLGDATVVYRSPAGVFLGIEWIERSTTWQADGRRLIATGARPAFAIHIAADRNALAARIATMQKPHQVSVDGAAIAFDAAAGVYNTDAVPAGTLSIKPGAGQRPVTVSMTDWPLASGIELANGVAQFNRSDDRVTCILSHPADSGAQSWTSAPGLLLCSAPPLDKTKLIGDAAGYYELYDRGGLIAALTEIAVYRLRRPGGPADKWVTGARHETFPLHYFQNIANDDPAHSRIIDCNVPERFSIDRNEADGVTFHIRSRDRTGAAVSDVRVEIPRPTPLQLRLDVTARFTAERDIVTDSRDAVEFFDPLGPWQPHPVYRGKQVQSWKTIADYGLSWYNNYHDFTFVLDAEGRFGAVENDRASAGNRLGQIRAFARDARLGIGSIVGQVDYTGPVTHRVGDIVVLVQQIRTQQDPVMDLWLCPAFRDVHFRFPVVDTNVCKLNAEGKPHSFVIPGGTDVSATLSFNLFGTGVYSWKDFRWLTEARYGAPTGLTGDDNGFAIAFERGRYQCWRGIKEQVHGVTDRDGRACAFKQTGETVYAWGAVSEPAAPLRLVTDTAVPPASSVQMIVVQATAAADRKAWPVALPLRLPAGTTVTGVQTQTGDAVPYQAGYWADNPETPAREAWLSWRADFAAGRTQQFSVTYAPALGALHNSARVRHEEGRLTVTGDRVRMSATEDAGPFRLSSIEVKTDGAWQPAVFRTVTEQIHGAYIGGKGGAPDPDANRWSLVEAAAVEDGPVRSVLRCVWQTASGLWQREQLVVVYDGIPGAELRQDTIWQGDRSFICAGWPGTIRRVYDFAGTDNTLTFMAGTETHTFAFTADKTGPAAYAYDMGQAASPRVNDHYWSVFESGGRRLALFFLTPYQQERALATSGGTGYGEYYWLFKQDFLNRGDRFQESRFLLADPGDLQAIETLARDLPTRLGRAAPEFIWADRYPVRVARKNPSTPELPEL